MKLGVAAIVYFVAAVCWVLFVVKGVIWIVREVTHHGNPAFPWIFLILTGVFVVVALVIAVFAVND